MKTQAIWKSHGCSLPATRCSMPLISFPQILIWYNLSLKASAIGQIVPNIKSILSISIHCLLRDILDEGWAPAAASQRWSFCAGFFFFHFLSHEFYVLSWNTGVDRYVCGLQLSFYTCAVLWKWKGFVLGPVLVIEARENGLRWPQACRLNDDSSLSHDQSAGWILNLMMSLVLLS